MLGLAGITVACLSHFVRCTPAATSSPGVDIEATQTVERWFSVEYEFTGYELAEIKERIWEFFNCKKLKTLISGDELAQYCRDLEQVSFSDVCNARRCVLAIMARHPRLYTVLLPHFGNDPTALIALHKFFAKELDDPQHRSTQLTPTAELDTFIRSVERIPAELSERSYLICSQYEERSKLNLITLAVAKAKWEAKNIKLGLKKFFTWFLKPSSTIERRRQMIMMFVNFLHELGYQDIKALCTDSFSELLLADYRRNMPAGLYDAAGAPYNLVGHPHVELRESSFALINATIFRIITPECPLAEPLLGVLLDLWGTGEIEWASKKALSEFCYKHRRLLFKEPARVVSLLQREYDYSQPGRAEELSPSSLPVITEEFNRMEPSFAYLLYYFSRRLGLFDIPGSSQRFFNILDDEHVFWLMEYLSMEADPAVSLSIDDFLRSMAPERQRKLHQWAGQYLTDHSSDFDPSYSKHSLYNSVKLFRDMLSFYSPHR